MLCELTFKTRPQVVLVILDPFYSFVYRLRIEATNTALSFPTTLNEYWTSKKGRNIRTVLVNYAKSKNLDPLRAETWYSISRKTLENAQVIKRNLIYLIYLMPFFIG
jgi:hypothetical protein